MSWETVKVKLEQILQTTIKLKKLTEAEWEQLKQQAHAAEDAISVEHNHEVLFLLGLEGDDYFVFAVEAVLMMKSERQLVEMMLEVYRKQYDDYKGSHEPVKKKAEHLSRWIAQQIELGVAQKELPEQFAADSALFSGKVPLLLYGEYSDQRKVSYQELESLLNTFFDVDILLIPLLNKEWLVLCPESLLDSEDDVKDIENCTSIEESLKSICSGLFEMLVNEGIGECHISIHYPMIPAKSLLSTVVQLRDAILLGRTYHVGQHIHLPWALHLEKVLNLLPDLEKKQIADHILKRNGYMLDSETLLTLEQFFNLDCNVSETARTLYIHRNTLLYRLDKFKQGTGLDVRTFRDAVIVKISLLLYKVTKRL